MQKVLVVVQPRRQQIFYTIFQGSWTFIETKMARGNQRDKAREANQKKMADQVG
jgi:hypothetical protein